MTLTRSNSILSWQLTPMQLPEAIPKPGITSFSREAVTYEMTKTQILVSPGKPSEMVLQVRNLTQNVISLQVELTGNFPRSWVRIHGEGEELLPRQEMLIGIYFEVPTDFFENDSLWRNGQGLPLDYQSNLELYYRESGRENSIGETLSFSVYIRPESLYLNFLPDLYREVDFIGRFLKIFEQTFEPSVTMLEALWAYLDPLTSPEALLPFLAHWVGWRLIPGLEIHRQRELIRHAITLYRLRGTKRGLRLYLHLYTGLPLDEEIPDESGKHIGIEEPFGTGFIIGDSHLGLETVLGGGRAYHFIVRLRSDSSQTIDESLIRTIIEQEKPVWCTYELHL